MISPPPLRQWVQQIPPSARLVLGADFVSNVGNGMVLPFLAIYVGRIHDHGLGVGSAAVSLFAAGCLIANLAAGRAVDRWGARPVVAAGWVGAAGSEAGLILGGEPVILLAASFLIGGGVGAAYPAMRALLGETTRPEQRSLVFGAEHGLLNVGLSTGVLVAAAVLTTASLERYQLLYTVDAISFLVAAALITRVKPGPLPAATSEQGDDGEATADDDGSLTRYRRLLHDRLFLRVCLLHGLIVVFGYAQMHSALPLFLSRPGGLPPWAVAVVFAANTVFVAVVALPAAALLRHKPRQRLLMAGAAFLALCWAVLLISTPDGPIAIALGVAITAVVVMGVGEVMLAPSLGPLPNDLAPPGSRGLYNSADAFVLSAGTIIGPAITGLLLTATNTTILLATLTVGCLAAVGAASRVHPPAAQPIPTDPQSISD